MSVSGNAHAYLDPGSGSFILQMLIAGLLGAIFTVKMWYAAVKIYIANIIKHLTGENKVDAKVKNNAEDD